MQPAHNTSASAHEPILNSLAVTQEDVVTLAGRVAAQEGLGGYVAAYDFGVATPDQATLTAYAKSQIWPEDPTSHADTDIFNGTRVENLNNGTVWILANTPTTDPAVFEWIPAGNFSLAPATETALGGLTSSSDPLAVSVDPVTGKATVNGALGLSGGEMTGALIAGGSQDPAVAQMRNQGVRDAPG